MNDIVLRKVIYQLPDMDNVRVKSNNPYNTKSNELTFDLYLPIMLYNHAMGEHAFDIYNDDAISRETIRLIFEFFQFHLNPYVRG